MLLCYFKNGLTCLVYTNDVLSTFDNTTAGHELYDSLVTMLKTKFELGDDGHQDCTDFIGMHFQFNADRSACIVTQPQKIHECVSAAGMDNCHCIQNKESNLIIKTDT